MAESGYAFIKAGDVINIAVFDDPSDELLAHFKLELSLDAVIPVTEKTVIGGTWDGTKFWLPQPYPSWIADNITGEWISRVPMPKDNSLYIWDEPTLSWKEVK
jgi:hypothetical protein